MTSTQRSSRLSGSVCGTAFRRVCTVKFVIKLGSKSYATRRFFGRTGRATNVAPRRVLARGCRGSLPRVSAFNLVGRVRSPRRFCSLVANSRGSFKFCFVLGKCRTTVHILKYSSLVQGGCGGGRREVIRGYHRLCSATCSSSYGRWAWHATWLLAYVVVKLVMSVALMLNLVFC